ncbi:MAG: hypothetical protein AAFY26_12445, partial [Cyanobacteria bacterium J06638_22]
RSDLQELLIKLAELPASAARKNFLSEIDSRAKCLRAIHNIESVFLVMWNFMGIHLLKQYHFILQQE